MKKTLHKPQPGQRCAYTHPSLRTDGFHYGVFIDTNFPGVTILDDHLRERQYSASDKELKIVIVDQLDAVLEPVAHDKLRRTKRSPIQIFSDLKQTKIRNPLPLVYAMGEFLVANAFNGELVLPYFIEIDLMDGFSSFNGSIGIVDSIPDHGKKYGYVVVMNSVDCSVRHLFENIARDMIRAWQFQHGFFPECGEDYHNTEFSDKADEISDRFNIDVCD